MQVENEEIMKGVAQLSKRPSQQRAVQIAVEILNARVMKATLAFKQFLTDH